jgi:hypothetical protein
VQQPDWLIFPATRDSVKRFYCRLVILVKTAPYHHFSLFDLRDLARE